MLSVNLCPLGLSVDRLAVVFAFLAALVVGWLVGRRRSVGRGGGVGTASDASLAAEAFEYRIDGSSDRPGVRGSLSGRSATSAISVSSGSAP